MKPKNCTNSVEALQDHRSYQAPTTNHHIKNKKKTYSRSSFCNIFSTIEKDLAGHKKSLRGPCCAGLLYVTWEQINHNQIYGEKSGCLNVSLLLTNMSSLIQSEFYHKHFVNGRVYSWFFFFFQLNV